MKLRVIIISLTSVVYLTSCHDLNLNPLSKGSTETWYSNVNEIKMSVDELYRMDFWNKDISEYSGEYGSDDWCYRETLSDFEKATLNGQNGIVQNLWNFQYKDIARANSVIQKADRAIKNGASESVIANYVAEARFHRACAYSKLLFRFGDVPLIENDLSIEEGMKKGRTEKTKVLKFIYDEFDAAASVLPEKYNMEQRATKGAALAMKARIATFMGDWNTAAEAAKAVIDLNIYKLHPSYSDLFLQNTKQSDEFIFLIPRSLDYSGYYIGENQVRGELIRNAGGWASTDPSWDLFASYVCTDGLPIDESPLFDSHDPFKNRDPRLSMTIVPFGSEFLGYEYSPHPDDVMIMNYKTGKEVKNNDNRANAQFASYNGLVWKKGIDDSWLENGNKIAPNLIVIRYADVLLMYAEAKIELNQIDQSALDAMNAVRARAYGVDKSETDKYPEFTNVGQEKLRVQLRTERRMEFAKEAMRYSDLVRWKLSEIVMKRKSYGMLYPTSLLVEQVTSKGDWFWPFAPDIDENGLPDFTKLESAGKISVLAERRWDNRQYLWPIPTNEILINENMKQNPGY